MITKANFVEQISGELGYTKTDAAAVYDTVFELLANNLMAGEDVSIPAVGRFKIVERNERVARNPQTGEAITVPAHKVLKLRPTTALKEAIAQL